MDDLRAKLAAAEKRANSLETLIHGLHFNAFGDRNYVYSGPQETVELVIADLKATQKERDAATERAEKAERERDSLQRDFDAVTAEMNGQDLGEILAKARMK